MLLEGQRVLPAKLLHKGFRFQYPDIGDALNEVVKGNHWVPANLLVGIQLILMVSIGVWIWPDSIMEWRCLDECLDPCLVAPSILPKGFA